MTEPAFDRIKAPSSALPLMLEVAGVPSGRAGAGCLERVWDDLASEFVTLFELGENGFSHRG